MHKRSPVVHRVEEMLPLINEHRQSTESGRRVAQPIVDALMQRQLTRMALPQPQGELEVPTVEALKVYEKLGGAEASVGWVTWNASLACIYSRCLSEGAREEIFSEAHWFHANSTRPSGKAVNGARHMPCTTSCFPPGQVLPSGQ